MKNLAKFVMVVLAAHGALADTASRSVLPDDATIRQILVQRIDQQHRSMGMVVGIVEPAGRRVIAYGAPAKDAKRPLDGDTLFEIGSTTKAFTALLLTDMAARGEVSLTDPVAKFLPDVKIPERGGRKITLLDLATHTSGLPRLPDNMNPKDPANPYADYTVQQLEQFLSAHLLARDIGSEYEYSNLGAGLLGHVLARRAGMDYEALVKKRIAQPLGMKSTAITLTPALKARLAVGHSEELQPVPNWDIPTLAGAGALRSTVNDLLTFVEANLDAKSPLAAPMKSMRTTRRPAGASGMEIGLGWHISQKGDREIVWHNGGTYGYRSFVGFDPARGVGVVVLSNAGTNEGGDDIGRHLLDSTMPLYESPQARKEVAVDLAKLDGYVGRYQMAPQFIITITRDGESLFLQATGQPRFQLFPSAEREFFLKVVDAQVTFEPQKDGRTPALVLHQNGAHNRAPRIEAEPVMPKVVLVDAKTLEGYTGRYALAPSFILTVTRDEHRLFVQATGQPRHEVFAESDRKFFYTVVDAQITFEVDAAGKATSLTLHQNGQNMPGKRVE